MLTLQPFFPLLLLGQLPSNAPAELLTVLKALCIMGRGFLNKLWLGCDERGARRRKIGGSKWLRAHWRPERISISTLFSLPLSLPLPSLP